MSISISMIFGCVVLYLLISRSLIGFAYVIKNGKNITSNKDYAAYMFPPAAELLLIVGILWFFLYLPVAKFSELGVKIHKNNIEKEVNRLVLERQRQNFDIKLAQYGLSREEIPGYIELDNLELYVSSLNEVGLAPNPVNLDEIRKEVEEKYMKAVKNNKSYAM